MVLRDAWALWFLVPLWAALALGALVVTRLERRGALSRSAAIGYSSLAALAAAPTTWAVLARRALVAVRLACLALLVVALARPQSVRALTPLTSEGIDIVLALDTSESMSALDLDADKRIQERRTRLAVVKDVVREFVRKRGTDQIGVVVFGEEAFAQVPLTLDHALVDGMLERLEIGAAGKNATAIGSGLGVAVSRLEKSKAKSKVVVLLTDGINNSGQLSPKVAAEVAAAFGVKVYTIGAGTRGKAPFIRKDGFYGEQLYYDDVSIDDEALREVATTTGGEYFRAEDARALAGVYARIDALEKSQIESKMLAEYDERTRPFLLLALALLLVEIVLGRTRLGSLP